MGKYLNRILMLAVWLICSSTALQAEVVYKETFGSPAGLTLLENFTGWTAPGCVYNGTARIGNTSSNRCTLSGTSGSGYIYFSSENITEVTISGLNTVGYDDLVLSFNCRMAFSSSTFTVQVSTDSITFTDLDFYKKRSTTWQKVTCKTAIPEAEKLWLKFEKTSIDDGKSIYFDDIIVSGIRQTGERVEEPVFALAEGVYNSPQKVGIDCPTLNAEIYYTTDGTEPALNSQRYTEAVPVDRSMRIKAFAVKEGIQSQTASASYTVKTTQAGIKGMVGEIEGEYYALSQVSKTKNTLEGSRAYSVAGKIVIPSIDLENFRWNVNTTARTISAPNGDCLTATSDGTNLTLNTQNKVWTWSDKYQCWTMGTRAIIYSKSGYFKNYSISITQVGGETTKHYTNPAVETEIFPGYVRQITQDTYGTLCLPYAVDANQYSGVEFYSIAGKLMADGKANALVLNGPIHTLEAGTPYLFKALSHEMVVACNVAVYSQTVQPANGLCGTFEGVNTEKDPLDEGLSGLFVVSGRKLVACAAGSSLAADRAYVALEEVPEYRGEAPAKERILSFSETTDLIDTNPIDAACSDVYTLTGICVLRNATLEKAQRSLPAGIYLMKNKKILIK